MSSNSKISMRKVQRFVTTSALLVFFVVALMAAAKKQSRDHIAGLQVTLSHENNDENFLLAKDVEQLFLTNRKIDIYQKRLTDLDLDELERIAETNPWVRKAEVFVDNKNYLNIEVAQRSPVARVFTTSGHSFYIDSSGFEMPLSARYAYPVPVFTSLNHKLTGEQYKLLKQRMVQISNFLRADSFWNNQISQIDIDAQNAFVMVPTIGQQRILIGDTNHLTEKFSNLYSFYREVSNKIGWNKYEVLDVRFKGQVIASPSLGWVAPKDTGVSMKDSLVMNRATPSDTLISKPAAVAAPSVAAKPAEKPKTVPTKNGAKSTTQPKAQSTTVADRRKVPAKTTTPASAKKSTPKSSTAAQPTAQADRKTSTEKKDQQPKYIFKKK